MAQQFCFEIYWPLIILILFLLVASNVNVVIRTCMDQDLNAQCGGWRTFQPWTFQPQASTPDLSTPGFSTMNFSTLDFSTMNFWTMGLKSLELKLGVEKSGVEMSFNPFEAIEKVIYYSETYEPELVRSCISNYFLAQKTSEYVKVVLTGEGTNWCFYYLILYWPVRDIRRRNHEFTNSWI